ncbi:major facilitator superfamily domain-containing protein [Mucidula mucida]|nr:major facilitator superfamily domain-containing protein [Mucidula mucida]
MSSSIPALSRDGDAQSNKSQDFVPISSDEEKVSIDETRPPSEVESVQDFPLKWKITALCLGLLLSVGSSFSENTLGPLKSTFKSELKITNAQYGAISSATSLVNTILPILGGFILDYYGVAWGTMLCSTCIFVGAVISASGSNAESFTLVVVGRIVLGLGSTVIESAGSKILAHWFQYRGLAFVYGVDIAWGKVVVLIAKATAVPMRDSTSFWGWALWIPAIVCFANLIQNAVFVWWTVYHLPKWTHMPTGRSNAAANGSPRRLLPDLKILKFIPSMFWCIACSQILQAGIVGGFSGLNADIISSTRGSTDQIAGYTSALQQVIPIFFAPGLGMFFDKVGFRMLFVSFTSMLWIIVYSLIGFTRVNALGVMILSSVAQSFNAIPFTCSIPLIVPDQTKLGLTFGIWKAFNNAGSVIVDIAAGDSRTLSTPNGGYEKVISFFVAMKALEFCWGAFYGIIDRRYLGGILTMSEHKRHLLEKTDTLNDLSGRRPRNVFTIVGMSVLCSAGITAWVLYIKYSI